ncbi:MAG: IS4 family transposase [Limisphaerales bacterium]
MNTRLGNSFELFDWRRGHAGPKAELLVRAKTDRCLEDSDRKLFEELALAHRAAKVTIPVPRQRQQTDQPSTPGRPALAARKAQVEVRFKEVTISAPQKAQTRHKSPIKVWAIHLVEKNPPAGAAAIEWMLLTSIEVASVKQALRCVRWYCRRWRIEEWHRVMKSGCRILEHQNHRAEVLLRAIVLDAVIAWRIMLLTLLGREMPGLPCDIVFNRVECEVLELLAQKKDCHSRKP